MTPALPSPSPPFRRPRVLRLAVAAAVLCWGLQPAPGWASGPAHDAPAAKAMKAVELTTPAKSPPADKPGRAAAATGDAEAARIPTVEGSTASTGDPLEHLRQRLAERLTAARTSAAGGPYDLRVSPKANKLNARGHEAGTKAGARGDAGHGGARGGAAHAPHWDYAGGTGPEAWGGLKPEFALCKTGQRQSPIDIRGGLAVDLDPVQFDYQDSRFAVLDNGHTVQVELPPGNAIEVGGKRFELQQFHFHRPSEESIDGRRFEMSLHLVHKDAQGRLAVVALLFDPGPAHPVLQQVWNNLPLERHAAAPARAPLELSALLPADRRYYTYMGSLTTPPCSEGVQWIVMRQPVTLATEQIEIFSRLYPMNARPVQSAAGRRILQSN
jgi:carbonic anhydrase